MCGYSALFVIRYSAGGSLPVVYDNNETRVGEVVEHSEIRGGKPVAAHGQAEIHFWSMFRSEYGEWHRMRLGTVSDRITYCDLTNTLREKGEYRYHADIRK
jgi:hypothetical protein